MINIYGIASGMKYLHSHHIQHQALNPKNIIVDSKYQPKITDLFEFIRNMTNKQKTGKTTFGIGDTYYYLSPEKLQFSEDDDNENNEVKNEKSDIYSYAMIVFQIISNERPFKKQDKSYVLISKIINDNYRPVLSDVIPPCFRQLIERCWSSDPNERPSFSEIVEELETNDEFINTKVNKKDYYDYIQYLKDNQI